MTDERIERVSPEDAGEPVPTAPRHWPISGLVRIGLAAVLLGGLGWGAAQSSARLDLRTAAASGTEVAADTTFSSASLTCVGPELSGVRGAPDIAQSVSVLAEAAPTELTGAPREGTLALRSAALDGAAVSARHVAGAESGASAITVMAEGGTAPGLSAMQSSVSDAEAVRGLVAVPCTAPLAEGWFVAGGGAPGRQERLVLANPGANEVTVDIAALGTAGPIVSDTGRGIVVPARGRATVLVDAITAGEAAPVLHLTVQGGVVSAVLNDLWLDGSVPAGLDSTPATAEPSTRAVVPVVTGAPNASLRVAVPGETQGVVSINVITADGTSPLPGESVQTLAARTTADLSLQALPAGAIGLEVTSDVPIVAAAVTVVREGAAPGDLAWTPATSPLAGLAGFPLPPAAEGQGRQLVLTALEAPVTARVATRTGDVVSIQEVTVAAGRLTLIDLGGAESVWVQRQSGDGELHGAVSVAQGEGAAALVAVMPLTDLVVSRASVIARPQP